MPEVDPLPRPDSPELDKFGLGSSQRAIYRLLYENRDRPMTMLEIRERLEAQLGPQEQLDRRRRDLNPYFVIERVRSGGETRYRLVGRKPIHESEDLGISERVRAQVLRFGRCEQCGRTPRDHGVVLQVDHKMPQRWGGGNEIENLQALCEECNRGKKDYYRTLDRWGPAIREAGAHQEVHRRLVTMLELVHPEDIRSDVLEMVAHQQQYQEDWHKRLRELRELGWDYSWRKQADHTGRVWVYYRLTKRGITPPEGQFRAAITRAENEKKLRRSRP
ncbi:MAG TPA: HNH endonuclease signature motif containing protein [Solirubrobacteraceae bacterium]|nr:HNH endonuclease signature motif containing protein [Solirubrobacteraceae bacterium]